MGDFKPIEVRRTPNADTRTSNDMITADLLKSDSVIHIEDVKKGMDFFAEEIKSAGQKHDWTKVAYFDLFFNDVNKVQHLPKSENDVFKELEWYKLHITKERHHLHANVPEDVTLIDVLELVTDCVMAGLARGNGLTKEYFEVDPKVLETALWNTAKLLEEHCIIKGE